MSLLESLLAATASELTSLGQAWALIGGLAVSVRAEPRFTRDIDLAVALDGDEDAERLVFKLQRNFRILATIEQEATERLATVRLTSSDGDTSGVVVDLLFASSGIEPEIVHAAEVIEVFPGLSVPVARTGHLIALKLLARDANRPQDEVDLQMLLELMSPEDRELAEAAVNLIIQRGYNRGRQLDKHLEALI